MALKYHWPSGPPPFSARSASLLEESPNLPLIVCRRSHLLQTGTGCSCNYLRLPKSESILKNLLPLLRLYLSAFLALVLIALSCEVTILAIFFFLLVVKDIALHNALQIRNLTKFPPHGMILLVCWQSRTVAAKRKGNENECKYKVKALSCQKALQDGLVLAPKMISLQTP